MEADGRNPSTNPVQKANFLEVSPHTIYGHQFVAIAADEAHEFRNANKWHFAILALNGCSPNSTRVFMTATPCTTRPRDLWNLRWCMGIDKFKKANDKEAAEMEKCLRAARAKDIKALKGSSTRKAVIIAATKGDADPKISSAFYKEMQKWVKIIRSYFSGIVIRRTLQSVDSTGACISGLEPYEEHQIVVKLYQHEIENLEKLAGDLIEDGTHQAAWITLGSVSKSLRLG